MKYKKLILGIALIFLIGIGIFFIFSDRHAEYIEKPDDEEVYNAYVLLSSSLNTSEIMYTDYLNYFMEENGKGSASAYPEKGVKTDVIRKSGINPGEYEGFVSLINYEETAEYIINVEKSGMYYLTLDYMPFGDALSDYSVSMLVNGKCQYLEQQAVILPLYWKDATDAYQTDRYGDEIAPQQVKINEWKNTPLYNNTYITAQPLLVPLKAGKNSITFTNVSNDGLGLGLLTAAAPENTLLTYEEYIAGFDDNKPKSFYEINAISYDEKNSAKIIYTTENNAAMKPFDVVNKKLNAVNMQNAGDTLTYTFKVDEDGLYNLAFHYMNDKKQFNSFASIYIDGVIPFKEMQNYAFAYTNSGWANEVLKDAEGNPMYVYLTAGTHSITFKIETEPVQEAYRYARLIAQHATQFALEITKISGTTADEYRTWKMTKYIPEIPDYLAAYKTLLQEIRYEIQYNSENGINGSLMAELDKTEGFVDLMAEYPDEIALYVADLTGRDNSVLVYMSTFTSNISTVNFSLDRIYVYNGKKLPKAEAGVFTSIKNGIVSLAGTFTSDKYKTDSEDEDVLTIWVNRAMTHTDLLQKMLDTEFTPKTGIKTKVTVMTDPGKLTMAAAADATPDVALGLASYMPFDMACRGALYDMTQFEDFWTVAGRFAAGSMVPFVYNEGVYAIPETLDFYALIYRTDVFNTLGFEVPDTWDDVITLLPQLQRYGMNFYHNVSSGVGYKWFYQTTPLILQNNGSLYAENGLTTAINSPDSVKGLKVLGDLFIAYSLDIQVNSFFNSFRYNVLPVGICSSADYILIKNGAKELDGSWALAAYPGTVQEDGSVSRWYIANGTNGAIFEDSDKKEEAWEFLKWWTSHDVQVEYTYTLQSTYGDTYFWMSSNIDALSDAPFDHKDKEVILDMVKWLRDVPRTPGQYLVERSLSDIWNAMVNQGTSAQVAADEKVIDINREIKKKMEELGFYDGEGNLVKPYVIRDVDWIQEKINEAQEVK